MAKQFPDIDDRIADFISRQHIFFSATAAPTGRVNVSPRPATAFKVLSPNRAVYLDQTGSSNEAAAHLKLSDRITIMFCAVEGPPQILRLYGTGRIIRRDSDEYAALLADTFGGEDLPGARQMVMIDVDLVQTSCGFGVPLFDFKGERDSLNRWASAKTPEELEAYQREKNVVSLDGFPTGLFEEA
ncbi:pyridoxamine 5'-phosphate oxidase family protein [Roseibium sp.]|uniref:pyridoxamine 5'-phosphate oxidase family protein n=1 Tax=Roseibium sp. TaxID=1936156 RepID=UPI003A96AFB5